MCMCASHWKKQVFSNCCYMIATFYFSREGEREWASDVCNLQREKNIPCRCNFTSVTAFFSHFLDLSLFFTQTNKRHFLHWSRSLRYIIVTNIPKFLLFTSCLFDFYFILFYFMCTSTFFISFIITFVWWK